MPNPTETTQRSRPRPGTMMTRGADHNRGNAESFDLAALIRSAQTAAGKPGGVYKDDDTFVSDRNLAIAPASLGHLSIRAQLPDLINAEGQIVVAPQATPAQETRTIGDVAMQNSRVVRNGAHLIEITPPRPLGDGYEAAFQDMPSRFEVIAPAAMEIQTLTASTDPALIRDKKFDGSKDEAEVAESPFPKTIAKLDRGTLTRRAIRFKFTRAQLRDYGAEHIAQQVMMSLALGLGRAVDQELFNGLIGAGITAEPTLETIAALGLRADEVRALVGQDAHNAAFEQGKLYVYGVPAEFTADITNTIVGAWDRFAIAVEPEVSVLVEKTRNGSLIFTAHSDMAPLIPDPAFAWKTAL